MCVQWPEGRCFHDVPEPALLNLYFEIRENCHGFSWRQRPVRQRQWWQWRAPALSSSCCERADHQYHFSTARERNILEITYLFKSPSNSRHTPRPSQKRIATYSSHTEKGRRSLDFFFFLFFPFTSIHSDRRNSSYLAILVETHRRMDRVDGMIFRVRIDLNNNRICESNPSRSFLCRLLDILDIFYADPIPVKSFFR